MNSFEIGSKANRRARPEGDLDRQLQRVLKFMKRSAQLYDEGDEDEAIPLALEMRKLLYDRHSSRSLLGQLGIKDQIMFVDSGIYPEKWRAVQNKIAEDQGGTACFSTVLSLSDVRAGKDGVGEFCAPLSEPYFDGRDPFRVSCPIAQRFEAWWNTPLIEGSSRRCFSRSNLVMIIADQENGAHVDPELDGDFQDLCVDTLGIGAVWHSGEIDFMTADIPNVTKSLPFSAVRQIAWEVMTSLERWTKLREPGQILLAHPYERELAVRWIQQQPMTIGL